MKTRLSYSITGLCMVLSITALLFSRPALAHHSFAMFDRQKSLTVNGTVKEFQWTNPHAWLQVMTTNDKGQMQEWSLELGSPNSLSRSGLKKNSFKPGDIVTVEISPLKDGSPGGSLNKVTMADGAVISFGAGGNSASFDK